eukprot:2919209-Rhodomonas_salina.5
MAAQSLKAGAYQRTGLQAACSGLVAAQPRSVPDTAQRVPSRTAELRTGVVTRVVDSPSIVRRVDLVAAYAPSVPGCA